MMIFSWNYYLFFHFFLLIIIFSDSHFHRVLYGEHKETRCTADQCRGEQRGFLDGLHQQLKQGHVRHRTRRKTFCNMQVHVFKVCVYIYTCMYVCSVYVCK